MSKCCRPRSKSKGVLDSPYGEIKGFLLLLRLVVVVVVAAITRCCCYYPLLLLLRKLFFSGGIPVRYVNSHENKTSAIIELKTFAGGATASAFGGIISGQVSASTYPR
jgi:hypothetical protein